MAAEHIASREQHGRVGFREVTSGSKSHTVLFIYSSFAVSSCKLDTEPPTTRNALLRATTLPGWANPLRGLDTPVWWAPRHHWRVSRSRGRGAHPPRERDPPLAAAPRDTFQRRCQTAERFRLKRAGFARMPAPPTPVHPCRLRRIRSPAYVPRWVVLPARDDVALL